ncbi:transglutaminase family protein [soil metagenome]
MIFHIEHTTRYYYSEPVKLEPMAVRLRPRADRSQRLLVFELNLDPAPASLTEISDLDGNDTVLAWFSQATTSLEISTRLQAETLRTNPFDYLVLDASLMQLPMRYPAEESGALLRYCLPSGDPAVATLAWEVLRSSGNSAPVFLTQLSERLASVVEGEVRLEGEPFAPAETLRRGRGSCRDAALLFMDICRSVGLAARFVSGYQEGDPEVEEKYLHAWAEVYLSRVGWRGFDPTLGLAVADRHLALAVASAPGSTPPYDGSYRGTGVSSMKVDLQVKILPSEGFG